MHTYSAVLLARPFFMDSGAKHALRAGTRRVGIWEASEWQPLGASMSLRQEVTAPGTP